MSKHCPTNIKIDYEVCLNPYWYNQIVENKEHFNSKEIDLLIQLANTNSKENHIIANQLLIKMFNETVRGNK